MKSQIITLCGSARFEEHFHFWSKVLTLSGHTVFSLACFPSVEGEKDWYTREAKELLDMAHKLKILWSDVVVILNVDDYIGHSTKQELQWARTLGKDIYNIEDSAVEDLDSVLHAEHLIHGSIASEIWVEGLNEKT